MEKSSTSVDASAPPAKRKRKRKHKGGRQTKYDPKLLPDIYRMSKRGHVDEQIARKIGISPSRFSEWRKLYPALNEVLKAGKDDPDSAVERSLFRMATGYEREVVEPVFDRKNGEIAYARYKKYFPPNTTAAIFWLKNRRKAQWADTHHIEQTVNVLVDMPQRETREEWLARIEREERERNAIDVTPK